jgi:hypothetical protein
MQLLRMAACMVTESNIQCYVNPEIGLMLRLSS